MIRLAATLGLALTLTGIGAGPVFASNWTPPAQIGPDGASRPAVGASSAGEMTVAWTSGDSLRGRVETITQPPGGSFGPVTVVSGDIGLSSHLQSLAVGPNGDTLALFVREGVMTAAFRPAGGTFGPPEEIANAAPSFVRVAVNGDGDALALWLDTEDGFVSAARPAGGPFEPAQLVNGGDAGFGAAGLGFDANGDAVAAWNDFDTVSRDSIFVTERPWGGAWSEPRSISGGQHAVSPPEVVTSPRGDVAVTWLSGEPFSPFRSADRVWFALRPPGGAFGPPEVAIEGSAAEPALALDGAGNAVVGGTSSGELRLAARPAGGSFGPAQNVPGLTGAVEQPLLQYVEGRNRFLALARVYTSNGTRLLAAERRAGGWQEPPFLIAPRATRAMSVAFDAQGRGLAVWESDSYERPHLVASAYDPLAPDPPLTSLTAASLEPARFQVRKGRRGGSTLTLQVTQPTGLDISVSTRKEPRYAIGYFTRQANAGTNSFPFTGRVARGSERQRLEPGRYYLHLEPIGPGRVQGKLRVPFRILRSSASGAGRSAR